MPDINDRMELLLERLQTAYDGIGHSSGRPYVYFVYPPDQERAMRRLADERLGSNVPGPSGGLRFHHLDLLTFTVQALAGQEERRQQLLDDPDRGPGTAESIMRLWARAAARSIGQALDGASEGGTSARPVIVLRGLGALHPLGNPTSLMESIAEQETRDPGTGRMVPIVLLIPGTRPVGSSRTYFFLGREDMRLQFYRGEEI